MWRGFSSGPSAVVPDIRQDQPHLAAGLPLLSHSDAHISLPPVFPLHKVRDRSPAVSFAPSSLEHQKEAFMKMLVCVGAVCPPGIRTVVGPEAAPALS